MICDRCKQRNATTHIKMVVNGNAKEEYLCDQCARGIDMPSMSLFNDDMDSIFDSILPSTGLLSFGDVSDVFNNNIFEYLQMPKHMSHREGILEQACKSINIGANKIKKEMEDNPNLTQIQNLKSELADAIEKEDYEKAGEIKKEIDNLKGDK